VVWASQLAMQWRARMCGSGRKKTSHLILVLFIWDVVIYAKYTHSVKTTLANFIDLNVDRRE